MKQDLAAKEIEQRLKQEIQRQKMNEALSSSQTIPEAAEGSTKKWKLQHCKNGYRKAIWHNKDWGKNKVNNHCGRPRSNEKLERTK